MMNTINRLIRVYDKHKISVFLIALSAILLPQFRVPFVNFEWFDLSFAGRGLILFLFVMQLVDIWARGISKRKAKIHPHTILLVLFFVFQSFSIVGAVNIPMFLKAYEKLVFGFMVFVLALELGKVDKYLIKKIILVYFFTGLVKLVLELFMYLLPGVSSSLLHVVFKDNLAFYIQANMDRYRTYVDFLTEQSLIFFLYIAIKYLKTNKLYSFIALGLSVLQLIVTFLSNWRGRFVVVVIILLMYAFTVARKNLSKIKTFGYYPLIFAVFLVAAVIYGGDKIQFARSGFSVVDRFSNQDEAEDLGTIVWRKRMAMESIDMAQAFPFGVGLNNYFEWTTFRSDVNFFAPTRENKSIYNASQYGPHNIIFQFLAETGLVGATVFVWMLLSFASMDLKRFKKGEIDEKTTISVAFWGILGITFFYPAATLNYFVSFFLFRALLITDS